MKTNSKAAAVLLIVAAAFLLNGCSGGSCSRQHPSDVGSGERPPVVIPEGDAILEQPVEFDVRNLEDAEQLISAEANLTPQDVSQIIVITESAVNHLGQTLDELLRNDDAADTWHMFNELKNSAWPTDIIVIIIGLERYPLSEAQQSHLADLNRAMRHNVNVIDDMRRQNRRLPDIFAPDCPSL